MRRVNLSTKTPPTATAGPSGALQSVAVPWRGTVAHDRTRRREGESGSQQGCEGVGAPPQTLSATARRVYRIVYVDSTDKIGIWYANVAEASPPLSRRGRAPHPGSP